MAWYWPWNIWYLLKIWLSVGVHSRFLIQGRKKNLFLVMSWNWSLTPSLILILSLHLSRSLVLQRTCYSGMLGTCFYRCWKLDMMFGMLSFGGYLIDSFYKVEQQFYQQFGLFLLMCHVLYFGPSVYSVHSIVIVLNCYVLVFCLPCILLLSTLYKIAQKWKKKKRRKLEKKI